jgi:NAD(P)-dependent dehydrogenase (short-subunit alcohol dehydrogenase family)
MGKRAVVVGGSRGLGRGAVDALVAGGAEVVAIARDVTPLHASIRRMAGDATDEALAERVLREESPDLLLLCAGGQPVLGNIHELTWEQFRVNWDIDAKLAFVWLRQALRLPMRQGSHIIVVSSGAAAQGSPVSGGYAAAKRAQWFMAGYAATESERAQLGIRIHCLLPILNASSELGRAGIAAYAQRAGVSDEEFVKRFGPPLTPAIFGAAVAELAAQPGKWSELAYRVTGAGLTPLG